MNRVCRRSDLPPGRREDANPERGDDDDDQTPCLEKVEDADENPGGDAIRKPHYYYTHDDGRCDNASDRQREDDAD